MNKKIKNWKTNMSNFEFTKELPPSSSAWSGHYYFAYDLVSNTKPKVIVELGTHKGNSLFSFAQAIKDFELNTKLHGVDTWQGDEQAGFYGEEVYNEFLEIRDKYYEEVNIIPYKMFFDDAVKKFEDNSIDILHIDGLHTYEAVKHDFENWLPKVKQDTGIILFHDVCEKSDDFGVYKLWDELKEEYETITLPHCHGLGIIFLGKEPPYSRNSFLEIFAKYYYQVSKTEKLIKQAGEKNTHIKNLIKKNLRNMIKLKELIEANRILKEETNILNKELENSFTIGTGVVGNYVYYFRKFKKYFRNFFINIRNDGPRITFKRIFKRVNRFVIYKEQRRIDQNRYKYWLKNNKITNKKRREIKEDLNELSYLPLISIIMPVYNVDIKWIKRAVKSIKSQVYNNWELCIADDASTDTKLIRYLKSIEKKPKIKIIFRENNGHISVASNSALELAEGEFVALMDNDDIIHPHALAEVVKVLNEKKETDFIYSDEDKITIKGKRVEPFFKPDWSPDLFLSCNYLCHLTVIRKDLINSVGNFRKGFEGSQDYDLFLRVIDKTNKIEHIPDILYSWRKIPGSTASKYGVKDYADKTSLKALSDTIKRRNLKATVETGLFPGSFRLNYKVKDNPLISIVIPTKDKYEYIERCISSLFDKTTYNNFEVIIIDTGSTDKRSLEYYKSLRINPKIKILHWDKRFNYSAVNNFGVKHSKGKYILLLNNDTEIITPNWIEGMLEHAQRKAVGAVGVKLYYPNDTIQHAGVVLGINGGSGKGVAGHAFKGFSKQIKGFPVQKDITRNYSAVTAACLMIQKKKYLQVSGLDETFRIAFNDVDFCIKLYKLGYYNIYTPYVELYHHESVSVGIPENNTRDVNEFSKEIYSMYKRWGDLLLNDPFYNKNYALNSEDFSIRTN